MSSTLRFNLNDPDFRISELLSGFPSAFKTQFATGIKLISRLTDQQIEQLLEVVKSALAAAAPVDEKEIASKLGMSTPDSSALILAANILAVALAPSEESVDQMLLQLKENGLVDETEPAGPIRFLQAAVRNKGLVTQALQRSSLTSESLPVMTEFEATVDVRPAFDKATNKISFAVPVLIIHIDTDKYGAEVWLQLSKRQLEKMAETLKTALKQMDEAERWSNSATQPQ
jgi:hypothetical protein